MRDPQPDADPRTYRRLLGLVAVGGAVGTAVRQGLLLLAPDLDRFPVTTFAINLAGAFALGLLLELLVRSGPDEGRRRDLRLLVGTGVLGGFTTYSALAAATASLAVSGLAGWAIAYALGTVALGAAMSVAGIALGGSLAAARPGGRATGGST
ncbi:MULTISPECIES: fluoride efflux transporter FluC [unclassified Agromyces]|uniref:fluoride efflux transporter FluC n=1 Tax=unclassified Agromyces TaxID=2639701 RepID=UPI0030145880